MIWRIGAFLRGMREFRSDVTTRYGWPLCQSYDAGRDLAHRMTFRRFGR